MFSDLGEMILFCLILCVYVFVLGKFVMFPDPGEIILYRRHPMGLSIILPSGHQNRSSWCRRKGKGGTGLGRTLQGPRAQLWRLSGTPGPGHSLRSTQGSARRPLLSSLSSFISLWGAPRRSRGVGWGSGATRGAVRTTPGRASQHTSAHGAAPGG